MLLRLSAMVTRIEECKRNERTGVRVQIKVAHDVEDVPSLIYLERPYHEAVEFHVGQQFTLDLKTSPDTSTAEHPNG